MGDTKRLTTEIEIKALISSAERDLKVFKESLESMWKSGEPPKGLLRSFEGLRQRLQSLRQFSDQGVLDLSELKTAKADCEAYTKTIRQLMVEFKLLTEEQKLAMLGSEEQEAIKKREEAIKAYTKELQKNTEEKRRNASVIQEKKKTTEEKQTLLKTKEQELEAIPQETRKAAEVYQKRLEEIAAINAKIKEQEELIDKYRKQGLSENPKSKNKLTASIDRYSELMLQRQQLGNPETEDPNGKVAFEQYSALFSVVTSLRTEIESLNQEMEALGGGDKAIDARTTKKFEELKETLKVLGVEGAESAESLEDLEKIVQQLKSGAIQGLDGEIEQIEKELESMGKTAGETGDRIEEAFDKLNNKKEHDQQVKNLQEKIKQFLGLQGAVELMRRAMSNAFSTIKDLDSAMREMAVVTDLSVGDYWQQLPEYADRASELGVSIKSAYEAATLYYQQGLKANEVTELSAQTLKMASIAGIDAAEATNKMTAALRGFNMELNETSAQRVADVYSELAAITAADVDQISSAMTKTASIASSAGMEFETTAAFLSQIIETTQESAETAGTAMKTVIARFQELKKAPEDIGEVDGEIVDANAIETALRSVGVSLRDASGQFRELDDVFLELSSKWDGLDKNTQRYIATIAAGSRQQSRFIAMMSDYGRTQELVSAANNSAGASAKQYEKTLESLEAKLNKLKNAWDQFTMGIMNSELVKIGVDVLTKFLEIVNKSTSALDGVAGSFSKIISVLGIFKLGQKLFEKFRQPMIQFFADVVKEAGKTGEQATQAMVDGAKRGKKTILDKGPNASGTPRETEEPRTVRGLLGRATGFTDLAGGLGRLNKQRKNKKAIASNLKEKRDKVADTETSLQFAIAEGDAAGVKELKAELKDYKEQLEVAEQEQQAFLKESKDAWDQVTQGISQAGSALVGVGTGISMLGGYLQELGLEEFGEGLSYAGQVITIVGGALMAIPPIISLINAGLLTPPLGIITGILSIILVSLIAIYAIIKNDKATKNLQKAAEAAEKAAEAAEAAKEAYSGLADSLDDLGAKYQALEELTRGTKEWNDAIQGINDSVIELISKYPELAKFVEHKQGVLTIEVDSMEVQQALDKYNNQAIIAQSVALGAQITQKEAQKVVTAKKQGSGTAEFSEKELAYGKALGNGTIYRDEYGAYRITKGAEEVANQFGITAEKLVEDQELLTNNEAELRQIGSTLEELDASISAVAQSIAFQAQQIADMSLFSEEEKAQAYGLVNNEDILRYRKELDDKYSDDDSATTEAALTAYMESLNDVSRVKNIRNNKIVYFDAAGERQVVDKKTYIDQMKSAEATKMAAGAMEIAPNVVEKIVSKTGIAAIGKAAVGEDNLTLAEANQLVSERTIQDLKEVWLELSEEERKIFGDEGAFITSFVGVAEGTVEKINKIQENASEIGVDIPMELSLGQANIFSEKLKEVFKMSGSEGTTSIVEAYSALVAGKNEEDKNLIFSMMSGTDWTNKEQLLKLQNSLEAEYGESANEIKGLVSVLGEASMATSDLILTVDVFGDIWKATEKINASMNKLLGLQWEYQRALAGFAPDLQVDKLSQQMIDEYILQNQEYSRIYSAATENFAKEYAKGATEFGSVNLQDALKLDATGLRFDESTLQQLIDIGGISEESAKNWVDTVKKHYDQQQEGIQGLRDTLDNIEQIQEASKEAYYELRNMTKTAILDNMQKQVELQQENLDATKEANSSLIGKIQESIDKRQQEQEQEKAEQNLSNMYSKLAYLMADTSGAGQLEALEAQKNLEEENQKMQSDLINQSIQELEDSNQKAFEQRERQIRLAEQQLDIYRDSEEFQTDVDNYMVEMLTAQDWTKTVIGSMILGSALQGLSQEEAQQTINELSNQVKLADFWESTDWTQTKDPTENNIKSIDDNVEELVQLSRNYKGEQTAANLVRRGFNQKTLNNITQDGVTESEDKRLLELNEFSLREGSDESINSLTSSATTAAAFNGAALKTKEEYYADVLKQSEKEGFQGETYQTYEEYLQNTINRANSGKREVLSSLSGKTFTQAQGIRNRYFAREGVTEADKAAFDEYLLNNIRNFAKKSKMIKNENTEVGLSGISVPIGDGYSVNGNYATVQIGTSGVVKVETEALGETPYELLTDDSNKHAVYARDPQGNWGLYLRKNTKSTDWYRVKGPFKNTTLESYNALLNNAKAYMLNNFAKLKYFKTGGLADFTGPAWLDGTPSRPEYILNATQTERFFSLIDVLESVDQKDGASVSGDAYFDININVEKLESDYDVEKVADKIRRMIAEDASYRNVNAINKIR